MFASLPPEIASSAMLRPGDIVMTAAGTIGKSLLYHSEDAACYAGYLVRFRPRSDVDERFVSYWMESQPYWDQIEVGKVVSTIENFSASKYQNLALSVPELTTQRSIADYLDRETARIDALIEKKQELLALLEEKFLETVRNQVTGGMSFDDPLDIRRVTIHLP
ncbi:MAG: restriction endonuclease subunit S [Acidimicrobiales bacterium]